MCCGGDVAWYEPCTNVVKKWCAGGNYMKNRQTKRENAWGRPKAIIGKALRLGTRTHYGKIHLWDSLTRRWEEYEGHIELFVYRGLVWGRFWSPRSPPPLWLQSHGQGQVFNHTVKVKFDVRGKIHDPKALPPPPPPPPHTQHHHTPRRHELGWVVLGGGGGGGGGGLSAILGIVNLTADIKKPVVCNLW